MSGIMDQIKAKAKGTMPGPNGALVPGPGGEHGSNQRNQAAVDSFDGQSSQGNLGRGFDQGNFGHGFTNNAGHLGQGFDVSPGVAPGSAYGTGLDQGDSMNTYGTTSAAGTHSGNTAGNIGSGSHAPQGTGFGGTTGTGMGHTGTAMPHTGTHTGHGMHGHSTGIATSPTPILGGEGTHTGMHTGHGMHGQHGHGMGTGPGGEMGSGTHTGLGQTGTAHHMGTGHPTDQRTGHMAGDDSHSYGAGVGPDHKAGHKASKATKGAQYDATGGAVDDRTVGQKIKDAFTPGSDVGKHTQH